MSYLFLLIFHLSFFKIDLFLNTFISNLSKSWHGRRDSMGRYKRRDLGWNASKRVSITGNQVASYSYIWESKQPEHTSFHSLLVFRAIKYVNNVLKSILYLDKYTFTSTKCIKLFSIWLKVGKPSNVNASILHISRFWRWIGST